MINYRKADLFQNWKVPSDLNEKEKLVYINSKRLAYYDNAQVWWCPTCKLFVRMRRY